MKLLIVSDAYPPELRSASQLMVELAEGLAARGHEVTVGTTVPGYNLAAGVVAGDIPRDEIRRGVHVVRVAVLPHHRVPYLVRGIGQLLLPLIFSRRIRGVVHGTFDAVIVHSPPLPLALAASWLAKDYGARFIPNIHDIFPQNGMDLVAPWQRPLITLAFGWMERAVYERAEVIVVPSSPHAQYLAEHRRIPRAKLRVVPHWIDPAPFDRAQRGSMFRTRWGFREKFVFLFGGVMGPSQELTMVLKVAQAFQDEGIHDALFLFVGGGSEKQKLERAARQRGLSQVIFKPFVSGEEYAELVKEADIGVLTLTAKNTTPAVPAKLMGYLAAGVPVIAAVHRESDALRIVREASCGFGALSSDSVAILEAFRAAYAARGRLRELGENGRRYLEQHFTQLQGIASWEHVLGEIVLVA